MSLAGKAVVSIWHDIASDGLDDFYAWHTYEHMPERVAIPGFLRGRRYTAVEGEPVCFTLYEAEAVDVLGGADYLDRLNNPTPWTLRAVRHIVNVSRAIQVVHLSWGPGVGGHIWTQQFEAEPDSNENFVRTFEQELLHPLTEIRGITGVHLCRTDRQISGFETSERKARDGSTRVPGWALLVEADRTGSLEAARGRLGAFEPRFLADTGRLGDEATYRLEYIRFPDESGAPRRMTG